MKSQKPESESSPLKNPLVWMTLVVIVLLVLIFNLREQQNPGIVSDTEAENVAAADSPSDLSIPPIATGKIERDVTPVYSAPGTRARQEIASLREQNSVDLTQAIALADQFQQQGELADAYLLYFFAAREGSVDAMLVMGKMSDPTSFDPANSLLNFPDAVQAHKWYLLASHQGNSQAAVRLSNLKQWALSEASLGNPEARQLLLYYE